MTQRRPTNPHEQGARGAYTRGYLPHFDHEGLVQLVTFRLADALPRSVVTAGLDIEQLDAELDRGHGACLLGREDIAGIVRDVVHHFDGERYWLGPWVIMPNHVHVLIRPMRGYGLGAILHSWKSFSAKRIRSVIGGSGSIWQREYFDRFVRDRTHFEIAVGYVHQNPVAAGLVERAEDWRFSSVRDASYVETLAPRFRPWRHSVRTG